MKITNEDLANELGITERTIIYKLQSKRDWTLKELVKLTEIAKQVSDEPLDLQVDDKFYSVNITETADE